MEKREKEKVGKNMRNIVLISHGELAEGMHSPISRSYSNREKQQSDNSYNKL